MRPRKFHAPYEQQDFLNQNTKDYLDKMNELDVTVKDYDSYDLNANYISDIFRWNVPCSGG